MIKPHHAVLTILFAIVLGTCFRTEAQTYDYIPDSSFNNTGFKKYIYYNQVDRLYGCKLQPDTKLVAAGFTKSPITGYYVMPVTRFLYNADFDTTFNGDGTIFVPLGNLQSIGTITPKVTFQQDGKIIVAGSGQGSGSLDIFVCRIDTSGNLDTAFNGTGTLMFDMTGTNTFPDQANAVEVDASGNIWVAGVTRNGTSPANNDFAVAKIKPDGTLDTTFDSDGKKLFDPSAGSADIAKSIKADSNGKILIGGTAGANMYVMRIDSTGTPDPGFTPSGGVSILFASGTDMGDMQIDNNGKIVVAGKVTINVASLVFARLNTNGTFDNTFGFNGKFSINIGFTTSYVTAICVQADNKIVVGGYTNDSLQRNDFLALRVTAAGALDLTFNGIGYVQYPIQQGAIDEYAQGLAITDDLRFIHSGTVTFTLGSNEDPVVTRFKPVLVTGLNTITNNDNTILAYPNPFSDQLEVVSSVNDEVYLSDYSGKTLRQFRLNAGVNKIDMRDLPAGMYFLHGANSAGLKLIKQ